jgi:hypothetical protein
MKENSMNGWQRIWVVACLITLIGGVVYGWVTIPSRAEILKRYNAAVQRDNLELQELEGKLKSPTDNFIYMPYISDVKFYMDKRQNEHAKEMDELTSRQLSTASIIFGTWLSFCLGLYAVGWTFGWVYRGFRPKSA